jgi:two-component system, NarL family, nitrate/nitrite response regulator NarL
MSGQGGKAKMNRNDKGSGALHSGTSHNGRGDVPIADRGGYVAPTLVRQNNESHPEVSVTTAAERQPTDPFARVAPAWRDGSISLESAIMAQSRARFGRPTRVLLSIGPIAEREKMLEAFSLIPNFEVRTVKGLDFNANEDAYRTDYLIVWFEGLQKLRETDANAFVKLSRRARVIIALSSDRLLEAASTLHLADAWLFTDMVLDQIGMLVGLSDSGYTIVPSRVGNDFGLDNLRCQLMYKLDDAERQVLEQLGLGNSNRDISTHLDISEPQTKAIVRNILSKLHFRNRTEAAVFMARRHTGGAPS